MEQLVQLVDFSILLGQNPSGRLKWVNFWRWLKQWLDGVLIISCWRWSGLQVNLPQMFLFPFFQFFVLVWFWFCFWNTCFIVEPSARVQSTGGPRWHGRPGCSACGNYSERIEAEAEAGQFTVAIWYKTFLKFRTCILLLILKSGRQPNQLMPGSRTSKSRPWSVTFRGNSTC